MNGKKNITKWFYWFTFAVAVIAVYKTFDNLPEITNFISNLIAIVMPFLIAIVLAYLFYTPAKKIENVLKKNKILKKKARAISVIVVYAIAIIGIIFLIKGLIPTVLNNIIDLAKSLPGYYSSLLEAYDALEEGSILKKVDLHGIVDKLKEINILEYIDFTTIGTYVSGAIGVVSGIFSVFVSLVFSIYLLISRHDIKTFFTKLVMAAFPENVSKSIIEYVGKTNKIFLNFIYCQILDGVIVGTIISVVLTALKVKYGILLGFMIGILNIIPYFGAIIGVVIASIITLVTGGIKQAILMLIITIVIQQLDSNIIGPHILGEGLKVSPVVLIFAVTVGGAYFGFWGMLLAVPVAAIIKIILEDYIEFKVNQRKLKNRDENIE